MEFYRNPTVKRAKSESVARQTNHLQVISEFWCGFSVDMRLSNSNCSTAFHQKYLVRVARSTQVTQPATVSYCKTLLRKVIGDVETEIHHLYCRSRRGWQALLLEAWGQQGMVNDCQEYKAEQIQKPFFFGTAKGSCKDDTECLFGCSISYHWPELKTTVFGTMTQLTFTSDIRKRKYRKWQSRL